MDTYLARSLERILREECSAYEDYLRLLASERELVRKFNAVDVQTIAEKRGRLTEKMSQLRDKREALFSADPQLAAIPLTERIMQRGSTQDKRVLLPIIGQLRELVNKVRGEAKELNQVVGFSLDIVQGSMSIIWSASHSVNKSYSQQGVMQEKTQQISYRGGSSLREA